ncbi:hypothetical protein AQI95_43140 [Streptomyces yokosukanensis]|uniref:Uncharacterized protein n=1 Tax=Streptomyces yokosukanensis TaxID=67386 RepID=A0A101NLF4_9ACTN|nr:AtaL-like protein [Streptomyces yokosukanensis]KUM95455.1 hypothetical protein AQI95_43140 [Streptomyces yokosukanensis]
MFTIKAEARVNDDPDEPRLSAEQLYAALVRRARADSSRTPDLVPPGHVFEIIEDQGDRLTRRAVREDGKESLARVTFHGGRLVVVDFIDGWQRGVIAQMVTTTEGGELTLVFTALSEIPGIEHNSPEEVAIANSRRNVMGSAPDQTIAYARQLARSGDI